MLILVIGGAASGKSAYAESLVRRLGGHRTYLATMENTGAEAAARIAKHRARRAADGYETVERPTDLDTLRFDRPGTVLLECLGNLAANERFRPGGTSAAALDKILRGVDNIVSQNGHTVIVTNEVFSGGSSYAGETLDYLRLLGRLNCELAARADAVVEVVCGIPCVRKGGISSL